MSLRRFPILYPTGVRRREPNLPTSVAWSIVEPHEPQAIKNHDQTLERLAERGGLSPTELYAVLHDQKWDALAGFDWAAWIRELAAREDTL